MTKRAVVAAVNDYQNWHAQGFADLNCCKSDADSFAQLLVDAFGFAAGDINVYEDGQATSDALLGAIRAMLVNSGAGDVACFYFSGHGDQVPAADPVSASSTYLHTFVPFSGSMISNNDIATLAQALEPSYVNLTLVLDSCFSGGVYVPGQEVAIRTRNWTQELIDAFVGACQLVCPLIGLPDPASLGVNISNPQPSNQGVTMTIDASKDFSDQAKVTLLSACNYNETAGESGKVGHGFFTQAILNTVNASGFQITHPDLVQALRTKVAGYTTNQTPQLRGRPVRLQENFLEGWNYSI